jgi:hypothetical protein
MMTLRCWKKPYREINVSMIIIEEDQLSKILGKTKIKVRWSRGRRETNPHFSEIIIKDNQFPKSLGWLKPWDKDQGNNP